MSSIYLSIFSYKVVEGEESEHDLGSSLEVAYEYGVDFFKHKKLSDFTLKLDTVKKFLIDGMMETFEDKKFARYIWENLSLANDGFPFQISQMFGAHFEENELALETHTEGLYVIVEIGPEGSKLADLLVSSALIDSDSLIIKETDGNIYVCVGLIVGSDSKAVINRLRRQLSQG